MIMIKVTNKKSSIKFIPLNEQAGMAKGAAWYLR
jgi:hypothetical protein